MSVVVAGVFLGGRGSRPSRRCSASLRGAAVVRAAVLLAARALAQARRGAAPGTALRATSTGTFRARPGLRSRAERRAGRRHRRRPRRARRLHGLVPAGPARWPSPSRCSSSLVVVLVDPPTTLVLLFTGRSCPAAGDHRRPDAGDHRAAVRRGPLAGRVLPRHAARPADAEDVRPEPGAGRQHPRRSAAGTATRRWTCCGPRSRPRSCSSGAGPSRWRWWRSRSACG